LSSTVDRGLASWCTNFVRSAANYAAGFSYFAGPVTVDNATAATPVKNNLATRSVVEPARDIPVAQKAARTTVNVNAVGVSVTGQKRLGPRKP